MVKTGKYGMYELPKATGATKRFRFGNHPIRHEELVREFGAATVVEVYSDRGSAQEEAGRRNHGRVRG